ncbi:MULTISPECIES: hypothetical protein [Micromonospora]|uniref:hypothetical protein n=1 Tax=Micromonospora TaxID=1873 RepID=UPI0018E9FC42|nr:MULTISPECIES: hypothetical protein [unclassified Micromonospora]
MGTPDQTSGESVADRDAAIQAHNAALHAARHADVAVRELSGIAGLRAVSDLFAAVWGRTPEGVPAPSELLRSLQHSGGCVTAAVDHSNRLVGAAALAVAAPAGTTYSLIAAVAPGLGDRGIGYAVKQHQRWWALDHGYHTMAWTFDPLVARNARFNLVKLGAEAGGYEQAFYGRGSDEINGSDETDRLVATWRLDARRTVAASTGPPGEPERPPEPAAPLAIGPDGQPILYQDETGRWCRVPHDILAVRRSEPDVASEWRLAIREIFMQAFADGFTATHVTRSGWYRLTRAGDR